MHTISEKFTFIIYADDTTLTCPLVSLSFDQEHTIDSISRGIDNKMKKVTDWLAVNELSLNVSKTKYMLFHFRQGTLRDCDIPQIRINEIDIERVDECDFLELTINENMTWNPHITKISNKISRVVGNMNRLKHVLLQSALKRMYDYLINSHLQFCTTAWGYQLNRVTKLKKRALRIVCGAKYNAHTEPLLKGCNILKFEDIFKLSCLKLYHNYINRMLPSSFNKIFTMNTDIHLYETRNRDNSHYFPYNKEGASKQNIHSMPNLINLLSADVRLKIESNLCHFINQSL